MGKKSKRPTAPTNRQNAQQPIRRNQLPPGYGKSFELPTDQSVQMPFVTDSLVISVLERRGLPEHLNSFEKLKACLTQAFVGNSSLRPFFQALAEGLEKGQPLINRPVPLLAPNPDKMPLLFWVCQYGFLNRLLGCRFSDDIVALVLKAGADPNPVRADTQTTPLFFAVKYCSLQTVDMLLEAGANIHHRDRFGQTCLKNALEYPKPMIVRRLLEYLPVTEMLKGTDEATGKEYPMSHADQMLTHASTPGGIPPQSWANLGAPAVDDFLDAFMLIRQKGSLLTQTGSSFPILVMCISFHQSHPHFMYPGLLRSLAEVLVGTMIPKSFRPKMQEVIETPNSSLKDDEEPPKCPICLENVKKSITLYCDHAYCRECILEHGKNGVDCPMCREPLCRDVSANARLTADNIMGVDRKSLLRRGPKFFTDEQVEAEARAQGIYSNFSSYSSLRDELETAIGNGMRRSYEKQPIELNDVSNLNSGESRGNLSGAGRTRLELASNINMVIGTPPSLVNLCPKEGMASIEVSINQVPLLARLSNYSLYTVISKSMVDQLGLTRIGTLQSKKFVDGQGKKIRNSTFTCLEPVKVCFQGIEVILRNAVEISPEPPEFMTTVQLGMDFLASGLLSVVDVEMGDESSANGVYYRVVGDSNWPVSGVSKESFRYYSHDGKVATLPLIHFDPFKENGKGMSLTITLREHVIFNQCNWCCRGFPEGMLQCGGCKEAFYCDERCQIAARRIHKLTCGVEHDE